MRRIVANEITLAVRDACIRANTRLRRDVLFKLKEAHAKETNSMAKRVLEAIIENANIAGKEKLAICQDTGLPYVFVEMGQSVLVSGDIKKAVNKGIAEGYEKGCFRDSVVRDPLLRGKPAFYPGIIHFDIVSGDKIKMIVLPKGFGSENKSQVKMFNPTAATSEIKKFVVESIKSAGPEACPPYIVGVGIGGTADYAMMLAKKALLKNIAHDKRGRVSQLEKGLLEDINRLNIGPMGLGGKCTCLGVNILTSPTHIAGLPVGVNISCHALRSAVVVL